MKLLVIIICLLSERFLMHSMSLERFAWFQEYGLSVINIFDKKHWNKNAWVILLSIVVPIILSVGFVYFLSYNFLWGFVRFILSIVIFLYCIGPGNPFYPAFQEGSEERQDALLSDYFVLVNRQLFSLLFWYVLGGPIAALSYRLITLTQVIPSIQRESVKLTDILEWVPARMTAFLFLLVGNFQKGLVLMGKLLLSKPEMNPQILRNCGLLALAHEEEAPLIQAETMVVHAVIILLVLIALLTLATCL